MNKKETYLQRALNALADIALAEDMSDAQRRHKAARMYNELTRAVATDEGTMLKDTDLITLITFDKS